MMWCPRLEHFVRFNHDGTVSRCGHMINAPKFESLDAMESSAWIQEIKAKFRDDTWPSECLRCQRTEQERNISIRLHSIHRHQSETSIDYLQVGGVLDNLCNAACITCDSRHSTRIGSLRDQNFIIVDNYQKFQSLPQERILHLDINGGEPCYSKNYKKLLAHLPPNLKSLRVNTNGSRVLTELTAIAHSGIEVTVTMSLDGVGKVHELVRWPLSWQTFCDNAMIYKSMPVHLNFWTTVSVLNVDDLPNIIEFAKQLGVDHDYAYLALPHQLAVGQDNNDQSKNYITYHKMIRGIS